MFVLKFFNLSIIKLGNIRPFLQISRFFIFTKMQSYILIFSGHFVLLKLIAIWPFSREFDWQEIWPIITPNLPFLSDKQSKQESSLTSIDLNLKNGVYWSLSTVQTRYLLMFWRLFCAVTSKEEHLLHAVLFTAWCVAWEQHCLSDIEQQLMKGAGLSEGSKWVWVRDIY